MLVVSDMKKLPEFGFQNTGRKDTHGREIWEKVVATPNNASLAYIVNPMTPPNEVDNVMVLAVMTEDNDTGFDAEFPVETLLEMVNAGVVSYFTPKDSSHSILRHIVEPEDKVMLLEALMIEDYEDSMLAIHSVIRYLRGQGLSMTDLSYDLIGVLRKLERTVENYEEQSKSFANSRRNAEKQYKCLRQAIANFFIRNGYTSVETSRGVLTLPPPVKFVEITDEEKIPGEYKTVKNLTRPDKLMIRRAIEKGKTVPGAELKSTQLIQIGNSSAA